MSVIPFELLLVFVLHDMIYKSMNATLRNIKQVQSLFLSAALPCCLVTPSGFSILITHSLILFIHNIYTSYIALRLFVPEPFPDRNILL